MKHKRLRQSGGKWQLGHALIILSNVILIFSPFFWLFTLSDRWYFDVLGNGLAALFFGLSYFISKKGERMIE